MFKGLLFLICIIIIKIISFHRNKETDEKVKISPEYLTAERNVCTEEYDANELDKDKYLPFQ